MISGFRQPWTRVSVSCFLAVVVDQKDAYLNNYMSRKAINRNLGGLGRSMVEIERKIIRQRIHIAFSLL